MQLDSSIVACGFFFSVPRVWCSQYSDWAVVLAIRVSIPGRGSRFFFASSKRPDRHWGPLNLLLNVDWASFPGGKATSVLKLNIPLCLVPS